MSNNTDTYEFFYKGEDEQIYKCKKPRTWLKSKQMKVDTLFYISCKKGDLILAKQIYKSNPNIIISTPFREPAFCIACQMGHLLVAKWLLQIKPNINIYIGENYAFTQACVYGQLHIAKWLFTKQPDIDISANNNAIFRLVCFRGQLDVAKWLIQIKPNINVTLYSDWVFRNSPRNIKQWLCDVNCEYKNTPEGTRILSLRTF